MRESFSFYGVIREEGRALAEDVYKRQALYLNTTFPYVTEAFREKIVRVSPEAVAGTLQGLLEKEEIDACVERVKDLQKYLNDLPEDRVVDLSLIHILKIMVDSPGKQSS